MSTNEFIDQNSLKIHQKDRNEQPLNAEIKSEKILQNFITPTQSTFHRNHDDIVQIPKTNSKVVEEEWKISIDIEEALRNQLGFQNWPEEPLMISYGELLHSKGKCQKVEQIQATATLECAGNRRSDLSEKESTEGIQWSSGAISTAHWYGISIRDLLIHQGLKDPYEHHSDLKSLQPSEADIKNNCAPWALSLYLHMLSAQPASESDQLTGEFFGASIPLSTIMHPQQKCILATYQNDQILTQSHGFPVRAVIPGHVGARWVKWLNGLRISTKPEDSPPMRLDYKLLKPPSNMNQTEKDQWKSNLTGDNRDDDIRKDELSKKQPMQSLGVGSSIEQPKDNETILLNSDGKITVRGYAVGQDGSPVTKVEIKILSQNTTKTETMEELRDRAEANTDESWIITNVQTDAKAKEGSEQDSLSWAWSLWQTDVRIPSKDCKFAIVARATTSSGIQQEKESPWNLRGFSTRSWPVVRGLQVE